ncbi:hypothetical protein ACSBR2_025073 [Camellia fascicularis]
MQVDSRTVRGYGSTAARVWYAELPEAVRDLVDLAGFGAFCRGLSHCPSSRTLLAALAERWWDTTNSFHFSAAGDMTMTPLDFAVLTGLDVGGGPIPYDEDMGQWEAAWIHLLGACPPVDRASGRVRYTWFASRFRRPEMEPESPEQVEQYTRGFLMFLFGTTLFADRGNTVELYLLSALVDLSQVGRSEFRGLFSQNVATTDRAPNSEAYLAQMWQPRMELRIRSLLVLAHRDIHEGHYEFGGLFGPNVANTDGASNSES